MDQASCTDSSRARSCTCYGMQCFTVCIAKPSPAHCNVNQLITSCTQAVIGTEDKHSVFPKALLLALRTLSVLRSSRLPGCQHTCGGLDRDNALHQYTPPLRLAQLRNSLPENRQPAMCPANMCSGPLLCSSPSSSRQNPISQMASKKATCHVLSRHMHKAPNQACNRRAHRSSPPSSCSPEEQSSCSISSVVRDPCCHRGASTQEVIAC